MSNYPKSKYAKILADSIYVSGSEKQRVKDEEYYLILKNSFLNNDHKEVIRLTENVKTQTLIDKEVFLGHFQCTSLAIPHQPHQKLIKL